MLIDDRGHRDVVKLLREVFLKDRGLGDLGVGKLSVSVSSCLAPSTDS